MKNVSHRFLPEERLVSLGKAIIRGYKVLSPEFAFNM
jgi:hypothetical protein